MHPHLQKTCIFLASAIVAASGFRALEAYFDAQKEMYKFFNSPPALNKHVTPYELEKESPFLNVGNSTHSTETMQSLELRIQELQDHQHTTNRQDRKNPFPEYRSQSF
jgi:hypothetical protein